MVGSFQELDVYKRAYQAALTIHRLSLDFPKIEQFALADQIRRASKSICANIAEGFARHHGSSAEFRRFLTIALGSSDEMLVWLAFCRDLGYMDNPIQEQLSDEYSQISRMLFSLMRNWKG